MDPEELRLAAGEALDELVSHVERARTAASPAVAKRPLADVTADLGLEVLIREGGLNATTFRDWLGRYLANGVSMHHPGQLAHQVGVPDVPSAVADLVHGVANNPMSIYEMGASAAAVEHAVLAWMLEKVGFDPEAGAGVLTHGGSLANLTALLAARARAAPDAWTEGVSRDLAILAPRSAHYSVARAAGILGLGESSVVRLEVDSVDRIRLDRLSDALARCLAAGRRPLALIASACSTGAGLHDDLRAIGGFCHEHGIWLHVDAAHGASALLSDRHRALLDGVELADSVIWDAHKMLRTSGLCAAVLVRRADDLRAAFQQHASYIDFANPDGWDVIDRQLECTKAEIGLKLFLNLAWRGERGLAAYVEEQYAKTLRFWELVDASPAFESPCRPESNILCFRPVPDPGGDALLALRDALLAEGDFHLSSAEIGGSRYLRIVVMSPATDEGTFLRLLDSVGRLR